MGKTLVTMLWVERGGMELAEAKSLQMNAILLPVSLKVIVFGTILFSPSITIVVDITGGKMILSFNQEASNDYFLSVGVAGNLKA